MPILRNPFRKSPADQCTDDGTFPIPPSVERKLSGAESYNSVSKPLSIRSNSHPMPTEYKLSEIDRTGTFIPPSPPDTKSSFWSSRSGASTRSSSHRSVFNENEPFNISRESFDSYRRSFDISARSPILDATAQRSRTSLDARRMRLPSSHSLTSSPKSLGMTCSYMPTAADIAPEFPPRRPPVTPYHPRHMMGLTDKQADPPNAKTNETDDVHPTVLEEDGDADADAANSAKSTEEDNTLADRFEDVGLHDDLAAPKLKKKAQAPASIVTGKKTGIFSRFSNSSSSNDSPAPNGVHLESSYSRPGSSGIGLGLSSSSHGIFGRKRGGSGQGAELGNMNEKRASVAASSASQEI